MKKMTGGKITQITNFCLYTSTSLKNVKKSTKSKRNFPLWERESNGGWEERALILQGGSRAGLSYRYVLILLVLWKELIGSIMIAHLQTNHLTGGKKRTGGQPIFPMLSLSYRLPLTLVPLPPPSLSLSSNLQARLSIFFCAAKTSLFRLSNRLEVLLFFSSSPPPPKKKRITGLNAIKLSCFYLRVCVLS